MRFTNIIISLAWALVVGASITTPLDEPDDPDDPDDPDEIDEPEGPPGPEPDDILEPQGRHCGTYLDKGAIPGPGVMEHTVTNWYDDMYVIGGLVGETSTDTTKLIRRKDVWRYNVVEKSWKKMKDYPIPISHAQSAAINGDIYVFGGFTGKGDELFYNRTNTAHVYHIKTDTWKEFPMPMREARASACTVRHKDGIIIAGGMKWLNRTGGKEVGHSVRRVSFYDTASMKWSRMPPLPGARHSCGAATHHNNLFVMGGRKHTYEHIKDTTWEYSLKHSWKHNEWKSIMRMKEPLASFAVGVHHQRMFTFGGEPNLSDPSWKGVQNRSWALDMGKRKWKPIFGLPLPRHGMTAATDWEWENTHIFGGGVESGLSTPVGTVTKFIGNPSPMDPDNGQKGFAALNASLPRSWWPPSDPLNECYGT
ncbi:hypothetical protein F4808DRAFT_421668 [Astrocystis sublimbata]|nr:hypothetical protein F4808DRAFT_421668 [Astrocystis sublimbata]